MTASAAISAVLVALGVALQVLACVGLVVMRDTYDRLHYLGAGGFGVAAIAAGVFVEEPLSMIGDKAVAAAALLLVTGPVLIHVTARAARIRRRGAWTIQPGEKVERVES